MRCPTRRPKGSQICLIRDKSGDLTLPRNKGSIEALTTGSPNTNTIVITAEIESRFARARVAKNDLAWFHSVAVQVLRARRAAKGSIRIGRLDTKCPLVRRLHMVREDTGAPNEGAICAWMALDEAVGCTRAFLTMWWSSRRLICRGCPESGLSVNDISRIHWSHLLTSQSERRY
ncbi:uncharacterized protein TNCV_2651601 [Trichonephila clavipes]|nr:uncharacterized protein TNCV_2651601 [Trichonephila clavipes]